MDDMSIEVKIPISNLAEWAKELVVESLHNSDLSYDDFEITRSKY